MPHATNDMPMTNGDKPSSQFLNHLSSYPVVSDGIEAYKTNPYGKRSLELADNAYNKFGKPVQPYLETPYNYAKPYVAKADELADSGLGHVETHFPIVKEDTNTVVDYGKSFVWWPFQVAGNTRDYVFTTWNDEYDKTIKYHNRGPGVSSSVMALISTELKIASDFFQAVADFLGPKYEESKKKGSDYVRQAQDTAEHYKQTGIDKAQEYQKFGQDKAHEYAQTGQQKVNEYQQIGQEKTSQYQKVRQEKAQEYQKVGEEKTEQAKQEAQRTKENLQNGTQQQK